MDLTKNRRSRTRANDLTRLSQDNPDELADLHTGERLTGKGDLTRRRTIQIDHAAAVSLSSPPDSLAARVMTAWGGNRCLVELESGTRVICSIRRLLRTLHRDSRSAVVAGDRVHVSVTSSGEGVIERVDPRATELSRVSRNVAHVIVANVDQAVIVTSLAEPELKLGFIDRMLCSTEKGGVRAVICINKIDLGSRAVIQPILGVYARAGYRILLTDALTGAGVDELRELLRGRETVFVGQSGVGKSSLLNAVQASFQRATQDVSTENQKGRHTTRAAELLKLEAGGWVVDTPGIRQIRLWDAAREEFEGLFPEFRPFVAQCQFPGCTHLQEPGCRVRQAVHQGRISLYRYGNYQKMMHDEVE